MNKKLLIPLAILAALAIPSLAYANPSTATATCQGGIVYEGHDYPSAGNTVTVKIDGVTVAGFPKTFGPATSGTVPFPDKTVGHTWAVVWDRYNGTDGDRTQSGMVPECVYVEPTTTTVAQTPPTTSMPISTTSMPDPTTTVVAVDTPPVPPTTVALVASDVVTVEPALPRTGLGGDIALIACGCVIVGAFLVLRGRRAS